jgi:cysteinyl-tRNA synthetase
LLDQGVPGEIIRFVMLSTHYRKPMDWTEKKRAEAEATLRKWRSITAGVDLDLAQEHATAALSDDLNVSEVIMRMHSLAAEGKSAALRATGAMIGLLGDDMGQWAEAPEIDLRAHEATLTEARSTAMQSKDFGPVDRLKAALIDAGVEVRMSKEGVELLPGVGFDPAKLENLE